MIDQKKIKNELDKLESGLIVLFETQAENMLELNTLVVSALTGNNYKGIIISTSRPYSTMAHIYKEEKINLEKLRFIDCLSKSQSSNLAKYNNVTYIDNVSSLTNISVSLHDSIKKMNGNKFVLIDSINTMLIHNKPDIFARFMHGILTRIRLYGINGILIAIENETNREVRAEIAQLCDKITHI